MTDIKNILADLRKGKMIILTDDEHRENEGDLVCAAEKTTPEKIAFMASFGRGLICAPLTHARAVELDLPPMSAKNTTKFRCTFTVSVDGASCAGSGISAYDRAETIRVLLDKKTKPDDLNRPGHIFPLIAKNGGVLERDGHTEGALDLVKLAGMKEVAVICEIMGDDGVMLRGKRLVDFAHAHGLKIISIKSLKTYLELREHRAAAKAAYRVIESEASAKRANPAFGGMSEVEFINNKTSFIKRAVEAKLPTEFGMFRVMVYKDSRDQKEHVALIKGKISESEPALVRVHSECLTGDVFHSERCDCNLQRAEALAKIGSSESGVFLYMRQEGRGIGLINKLRTYNLQDKGYDTVCANKMLGFEADARDYAISAEILKDIGVKKIHLMTNNPLKMKELRAAGLAVLKRVPLEIALSSRRGIRYMKTKKMKMGHLLLKV